VNIQAISDLHLEMRRGYQLPVTNSDVIVLGGDISTGLRGIEFAIHQSGLHDKDVIYICGNHEFYHNDYYALLKEIRSLADQHPKVHFLERDELIIGDTRFLGTILWTDFLGDGSQPQEDNMGVVSFGLNDFRLISNEKDYFTVEDSLQEHLKSRKWLEGKLDEPFDGNTVVDTHHAPSLLCQHPQFPFSALSTGFLSDMAPLVVKANLWLFGHSHSNLDIQIGDCRLLANQAGYPHEEHVKPFISDLVIEL